MALTKIFSETDGKRRSRKIGKCMKSQSAMEYLMTYGWAVLIIGVVIAALMNLGVFNSTSVTGTTCTSSPGFTCQNPTMITNGTLTFLFGQLTGKPLYNIQFECAASVGAANLPNPITAFNSITSTGAMMAYGDSGNSVANGQTITISSIPCYDASGNKLGTQSMGAGYSGYIYVNYTSQSAAHSASNPWSTTRAIVIRAKVV